MAKVQFGGIVREACLEYVPETQIGEYVLVHVGFAISRVDEAEAERTYQALKDLDQLTELGIPGCRGDRRDGRANLPGVDETRRAFDNEISR